MEDHYDPDDQDPWDDAAGELSGRSDDDDDDDDNAPGAKGFALAGRGAGSEVVPAEGDLLSNEQEATVQEMKHKLAKLDEVIEKASPLCPPRVMNTLHSARAKLRQQAWGNKQMDIRVARAIRRGLDEEETTRAAAQERREGAKRDALAIKEAKANLMSQQAEVVQRQHLLNANENKRKRAEDVHNAALEYENRDFLADAVGPATASKNRLNAFRRMMHLVDGLPAHRCANVDRDFGLWERAVQSKYPVPSHYCNVFQKMLKDALHNIEQGRSRHVCQWWESQYEKFIAGASLILPALPR